MSIERLCRELNIDIPLIDWYEYRYTWGGNFNIRIGITSCSADSFYISSWGGLMFRSPEHISNSRLTYDQLKESFLKYVNLLKPGEIPALDHLIHYAVQEPKPNFKLADAETKLLTDLAKQELPIQEPEPKIEISTFKDLESAPAIPAYLNLKPGPTHDWISALYRPYAPVV